MKEARHERLYTASVCLKSAKLMWGIEISTAVASGGWRLTRKRHKGTYWGDENILYLAWGGGYLSGVHQTVFNQCI